MILIRLNLNKNRLGIIGFIPVLLGMIAGCRTLPRKAKASPTELVGLCSLAYDSPTKKMTGMLAVRAVPPHWMTCQLLDPMGTAIAVMEFNDSKIRWIDLKTRCYKDIPVSGPADLLGTVVDASWLYEVLSVELRPGKTKVKVYRNCDGHDFEIKWSNPEKGGAPIIWFSFADRRLKLVWRKREKRLQEVSLKPFDIRGFDVCSRDRLFGADGSWSFE